ncbi:ParB/RepB/Spo0J family partition protein [Chroococcidiopsis sp. CCMEE 29]|uniref:ParB/RepB/Spo0J family partition protein n=1 Tax=Chroococcidiopsis sp. CCMEE 29 TaxID=155894 RepID=UPI0020209634|nr:ParB/RepB/Spo0J family partition protein [Chroococcidiopsis sp. CCMEE 29]
MARLDRTSKTQSDIRVAKFRDILNFNIEDVEEDLPNEGQEVEANLEGKQQVSLQEIHLPKQQPRRYFDPQKMKQLIQSVKEHGILEPLLVRPLLAGGYELVAGERRYRAAKEAGLTKLPVVVRELSNEEALQLALIENLQREDLNPIEETEGILQLLALKLGITVQEVAPLLYKMQNAIAGRVTDNVISNSESEIVKGVFNGLGLMEWESFTANRLPLLRLPEDLLEALRQGRIAYTKAQAISRVKDEVQRQALLEIAISESLSLAQIKERISKLSNANDISGNGKPLPLKTRIDVAYHLVKKSKIWDDPKKQKQLEKLLAELERLASLE